MTTKKARSETRKKSVKEVYTLADLQTWHDVDPPIRLGVFGDPVAHSLSPQMQNAALKHCKIDMQYARFYISPNELREAIGLIRKMEFVGLNLTIPHKIAALELLDVADENVKRIRAANVIKVEGGKLRGFNTDGRGFARAIREEFSVDLRDLRVMILGAGGAARAIALEEAAIRFQIGHIDLVVNATPLGLNRGDPSPIPARLLAPHVMVYDTIYSAERTPLVSAAIEAGARAANGLSMLLHQGALAFEIWFQREAPLEVMRKALL